MLKSYLESLSKDELVSLVLRLAEEHKDVEVFLESQKAKSTNDSDDKIGTPTNNQISQSLLQSEQNLELFTSQIVTRSSSSQEKINLYKSLFIGRKDVFALRWYNAKSNKSGYSPVCANKWSSGKCDMKKYSCASCPFKLPVALDDNYIFNHLAGRDEFCRDVIGLYPLMEGDVCRFLAMDFDSHAPKNTNCSWRNDILSVHQTCGDFSVPSYIEISRSGNGGHLWIFFLENISARLARRLGEGLVKASMQKRHSIPFETFDRFFPNQDEMPKGGYGNLIALPLQGKAVKEGYSVFVDDDFKPYEDQWRLLSSIKKLSEHDVRKIINEIEKTITEFVEQNESDETSVVQNNKSPFEIAKSEKLTADDVSAPVQIILSNCVEIKKQGISEKALGVFRRTAVFLNPQYFINLRMHLPLYNIPRYIDCSKENEDYLLLPRGNLIKVIEKLEEVNTQYQITDNREQGQEIDLSFSASLYEEQQNALNELLKQDIGILSAGTGFGKTVVASALISARKTNTLILVQSHALLEQWKKAIKEYLNFTPGTIAAGKDKSTGIVDIAIVNSLIEKKSDEVKTRSYKYGTLIIDECHHVSAFSTENLVASFKAKYVYGLTATPIRRDGHQKIIFYQCGQILYSTTTKQMNEQQNFSHYFIPRFTSFHYVEDDMTSKSTNPSINIYFENLVSNQARNDLIIEDIKSSVKNGRTPLILSERIEHLNYLYEKLDGAAKNVILITGKGTQKQKKELLENLRAVPQEESLIILATGKYAGEGFDYPRIDTLILAMPFSWKGTLAQYCGRLHRNFAGKNEVQIYDYVDYRLPVFDRMYQNRLKGYRQLGYSIKADEQGSDDSEKNQTSKIYSSEDYKTDFEKDLLSAEFRIIVSVPYLSKYNVQTFVLLSSSLITKGVHIQIIICKQTDESKQNKLASSIRLLEDAGIKVTFKESFSQKIAIIDEKILWYGNINFLGFTENEECAIRIINARIASEIEGSIL